MNDTRSFTIVIVRTNNGHRAYAPGFPHVVGEGVGRAAAYRELKLQLAGYLRNRLRLGGPIPSDQVVAIKKLRLNLREIAREDELV